MAAGRSPRRAAPLEVASADFDAVLARARANDPEVWNALYRWLAPAVAGYLRLLGARDPDDLTSEVLLAVFRRVDAFEGTAASFRSWVFTVAHSRFVDERRSAGRRVEQAPLDDARDIPATGDVEDAALAALELARVRQACAELPADQRAVVLLRIVGELSIDQVAAVLGRTPGAVKQLQRRGFERARALFAREGVTL